MLCVKADTLLSTQYSKEPKNARRGNVSTHELLTADDTNSITTLPLFFLLIKSLSDEEGNPV